MIKRIICTGILALGAINANAAYVQVYNNTSQNIVVTAIGVCSNGSTTANVDCQRSNGFKYHPNSTIKPWSYGAKYAFTDGLTNWIDHNSDWINNAPVAFSLSVMRAGHKYNIPGDGYIWKYCGLDNSDTSVILNYSGNYSTSRMIIFPKSTSSCSTDYYKWA